MKQDLKIDEHETGNATPKSSCISLLLSLEKSCNFARKPPLSCTSSIHMKYTHTHNPTQHTHIHTHTYIHIYIHTYVHTYIHTYIRTYVHTYIHTHIHTYIHTYIQIHIYTYIYITTNLEHTPHAAPAPLLSTPNMQLPAGYLQ